MSKKNKIYWFEGVTEKGVKALLSEEHSNFTWLRSQSNRRALVLLQIIGLALVALASYFPSIRTNLNLSAQTELVIYVVTAIFVVIAVFGSYSLLRIAVRGIADAPEELLDERQVLVRNSSFRYAYFYMGYLVIGLLLLMFFGPELTLFEPTGNDGSFLLIATLMAFASAPSMILAWRERDI